MSLPQAARAHGVHPDDQTDAVRLCIACGQAYTTIDWDTGAQTTDLIPLDGIGIELAGVTFVFLAADEEVQLGIDASRMAYLIQTVYNRIPEAYLRRRIDRVIIVVSSEPYCLRYSAWTKGMRKGLDTGNLSAYFTSERSLEDNGGCCISFPNTWERERVIWLPVGTALTEEGLVEHANCAYSYHIYCTEQMNLTMRLAHELVHALAISRTLPSLEAYGFVPNLNWELQWTLTGEPLPALSTAEAFAYDLSRKIMRDDWPQMAIGVIHPQTD